MSTAYHAKYFAYELTKRCPSDSIEKLAASLADAEVDLNPHQIDAALFAFRSPLSKGAILADEVGLGKTIEAGILLSQKWAERKANSLSLFQPIYASNGIKNWPTSSFYLPRFSKHGLSMNRSSAAISTRSTNLKSLFVPTISLGRRTYTSGRLIGTL
jgi:hypothetical protein